MPRSRPPKPRRLPFLRAAAFAAALLILPGTGVADATPAPGVIGDEKKPPQPPRANEPPVEGQGVRPGGERPPDPPRVGSDPVEAYLRLMHQRWLHSLRVYNQPR